MEPTYRRLAAGITTAFALMLLLAARDAEAARWLWDQNGNRIDDRIEAVQSGGIAAAHVGGDLTKRLILFVDTGHVPFSYGAYVAYDHLPTDADVAALSATGARLDWRPRYIQYLRVNATYAQIQGIASLAGVARIECRQVMYRTNDNATRTFRARDAAGGVGHGMFPSVWKDFGYTGRGVVVGILDTGVNDAAMTGGYPGHESLNGKFVGGGDFSNPDASLNTPIDGSANPANNIDPEDTYHATHVAGIAIGTGGPSGKYAGMAPGARLVDCKVLTDAGEGGGAAEALEWCIAHRNTPWSTPDEPGVTYRGIQVVNMSIGGMSASDGTDADCAAVNAAVKAGIVVCVATGNDGNTNYMPSPAAADLDVAVGALADGNTLDRADDIVDSYSNEGPRESDGDSDHLDEMKPAVCGSGSDIMSAFGQPTSDGTKYHNINGTSMACPTIAGVCALIRQANPSLTPAQVRDVLQNTSDHRTDHGQQPPSASDPFHIDPNYHPSWGWGEPDAVAAVLEAVNPRTTQITAEGTTGVANVSGQLEIGIRWTTQREIDCNSFEVWRAMDLGGYPGAFAVVSPSVFPSGRSTIERTPNRTYYTWSDASADLVLGDPYWYQVRWIDTQGQSHAAPAFVVPTDAPPVRARVRWAITHSALDNDVVTQFGSGTDPDHAAFIRPTGGKAVADSSHQYAPGFGDGVTRFYFHTDLTDADLVAGFLPPSTSNPWFLSVHEEGFVNTEGVVDSFSVTVFDPSPTTYTCPQPSTATVEGQTTVMWIPANPATSPNHVPVFDAIGSKSIGEGLALHLVVHATDADNGQTLTYSASGLPSGATFNAGTRSFDWTPDYAQAGDYTVTFHVQDSFLTPASDDESVPIHVMDRAPGSNTSPSLEPIGDRSVPQDGQLAFTVVAHDPEGDAITYSATGLPSGSTFDASVRQFSWTPTTGTAEGSYPVTFHASDPAGAQDAQTVLVTVTSGGIQTLPDDCSPDTMLFSGTIGANAQGALVVETFHSFTVAPNTAAVKGLLQWTGAPAIDLDLYLLDPQGNSVGSGATALSDPEVATFVNPDPGTWQWKVSSYDNPNPSLAYTVTSIRCVRGPTAVSGVLAPVPLALAQSVPNPFDRNAVIHFALPEAGSVSLRIYDISGRMVRTLAKGSLKPGWYQRVWDGRDEEGHRLSAGTYFYRLETPSGTRSRKMVMLH
jgi:hypothetical protein